MFAIITFLIILLSGLIFFSKLKKRGIELKDVINHFTTESKKILSSSINDKNRFESFIKFKYSILYLTLAMFLILFLSSFLPTLFTGEHLTGLFLVIHVTLAPVFAVAISLLLLFFSFSFKLNQEDFENLPRIKEDNKSVNNTKVKLTFWILALISIPLLSSIILILYPILGTESQNWNIIIHRISAMLFSIFVLVLIYYIFGSKKV